MKKTSAFQWAMMVLILERQIHPSIRLKEQDKYSERMATGEKALVMKQTMSVSLQIGELFKIDEIKNSSAFRIASLEYTLYFYNS